MFRVLVSTSLALVLAPAACAPADSNSESQAAQPLLVFGATGRMPGGFVYPRAIDVDPARGRVYVIDRSGRLQQFDLDGAHQRTVELELEDEGYPAGITVAPDGRVFVASTHDHEVLIFDTTGVLVDRFGRYGTAPGEFTFLCDIAFGPEGRLYVAEFGGNDRIQVFDTSHAPLFSFGSFGSDPGQFNRPQSIAFNRDRSELFIADAINNRVQVFDPGGTLLRSFGTTGTGAGEFRYPYGLVVLDDGRLLVTEFGNSRLQAMEADGTGATIIGSVGDSPGQFLGPWASALAGDRIFALDSRNSRVQVLEIPK